MKIQIMSDVHLEFAPLQIENKEKADVLILAGDIFPIALLSKEIRRPSSMFGDTWPAIKKGMNAFFKAANSKWRKCYIVLGNHEYYHGDVKVAVKNLNAWLEYNNFDNITILDCSMEVYKGVTFIGATLWTDLNRGNPFAVQTVKKYMYDYKVIANGGSLLSTEDTISFHKYAKEYLVNAMQESKENKTVVITHHAPSYLSVNEKYFTAGNSNYGFFSDLSDLIIDYAPNLWVHGHMHDSCDYMLDSTRVVCNPRGYSNIGSTTQENIFFNKNFALVV